MRVLAGLAAVLLLAACGTADAGASGGDRPTAGREPDHQGVVGAVTPFVPVTEGCVDGSTLPPDAPISSDDPLLCTGPSAPLGTVLVEAGEPVSVTVEPSTLIRATAADGTVQQASFADLEVGRTVAVYTDGTVLESYPVQVTALELVLLGDA